MYDGLHQEKMFPFCGVPRTADRSKEMEGKRAAIFVSFCYTKFKLLAMITIPYLLYLPAGPSFLVCKKR